MIIVSELAAEPARVNGQVVIPAGGQVKVLTLGGCRSHVEPPMFGDSAGLAAVAAGLCGLVEREVERPVAEPPAAAEDEAVGVVRAGPRGLGRGVTIFALLGHRLALCRRRRRLVSSETNRRR